MRNIQCQIVIAVLLVFGGSVPLFAQPSTVLVVVPRTTDCGMGKESFVQRKCFMNSVEAAANATIDSFAYPVYTKGGMDEILTNINSKIETLKTSLKDDLKKDVITATTDEVKSRLTKETERILQMDMVDQVAAQIAARLSAQFDDKVGLLEQQVKALNKRVNDMQQR